MKKKFFLITAILTMGLAVGAFIASCSSDSDEPTYENNAQRIEAMKAKVLKMAEMYGLKIGFGEDFERQCKQNEINLDSIEYIFSKFSRIKGHYGYVQTNGNSLTFDSQKEKLLKKRDITVTPREYPNYNGSFNKKYENTHDSVDFVIRYTIEWGYDDFTHVNYVRLSEAGLRVSPTGYSAEAEQFSYQYIGEIPNFTYWFTAVVNVTETGSIYCKFFIKDMHTSSPAYMPVSSDSIIHEKSLTTNKIGFSNVTIL